MPPAEQRNPGVFPLKLSFKVPDMTTGTLARRFARQEASRMASARSLSASKFARATGISPRSQPSSSNTPPCGVSTRKPLTFTTFPTNGSGSASKAQIGTARANSPAAEASGRRVGLQAAAAAVSRAMKSDFTPAEMGQFGRVGNGSEADTLEAVNRTSIAGQLGEEVEQLTAEHFA